MLLLVKQRNSELGRQHLIHHSSDSGIRLFFARVVLLVGVVAGNSTLLSMAVTIHSQQNTTILPSTKSFLYFFSISVPRLNSFTTSLTILIDFSACFSR